MANIKISELNDADALTGTELVPLVQDGSTVKATAQAVAALATGKPLGPKYTYSDTVFTFGSWDVPTGTIGFDNATIADATYVFFHTTDADSLNRYEFLGGDGTNDWTDRSTLEVVLNNVTTGAIAVLQLENYQGSSMDNTVYNVLSADVHGTFSDGDSVYVWPMHRGIDGEDGPNNITASTTTDLTGFLVGNGSVVSADNSTYATADSSTEFTNKSGNISQWTNDSGYIKADTADNLTNKSGAISQWTNDMSYAILGDLDGFLVGGGSSLTSGDWDTAPPATLVAALNRMSALLKTLNGDDPIP